MDKETLGCLWTWELDTDYVLCDWDWSLLPTLYLKDEIRFEYNQAKNKWSEKSCTIFSAIGAASDLTNYKFSEKEIKEIDEMSYERGRIRGEWWYVQSAFKLVADWWNANEELVKKYWKLAYYRISKYDDNIFEDVINKLYTVWGNYHPTSEYNIDRSDWMLDWTDFWKQTNWHAVDIICKEWQRSVKDSYYWRMYNIYGVKNKLSAISNYWTYFYLYTLVKEDNLEEIKRLNEIKSECNLLIEHLWKLYNLVNDTNFQWILHYTANKLRDKIKTCNEMLGKFWVEN